MTSDFFSNEKYCYQTKNTVQMWQNNFKNFFLKFGDFFPKNENIAIDCFFVFIFSRFGEISHPKKSLIMTYDINIQQ